MGMTLDEALGKEKQLYNKHINAANHIREKMVSETAMNNAKEHDEIAEEHRQIAEWLEKYEKIEQIVKEWGDSGLLQNQLYDKLHEVVEDGKNNRDVR